MNSFADLMHRRRSCRKFTNEKIDADELSMVLNAALISPTAMNRRAWHFVVVEDKTTLEKLSECKETGAAMLKNAAVAVVVLGNVNDNDCWIEDGSIAAFAMQLQAEDLGLGSCWVQVRNRGLNSGERANDIVRGILNIPEGFDTLCILALGHKANQLPLKKDEDARWEQVHVGQF
mgnify:CR=1 FL=1